MTQEEKQLLLKDLCARLTYRIIVNFTLGDISFNERVSSVNVDENNVYVYAKYGFLKFPLEGDQEIGLSQVKPYLRSLSSLTKNEKHELLKFGGVCYDHNDEVIGVGCTEFSNNAKVQDWLNAHHLDYRGLIPMGLALEAPEGMYKTE